MKNPNWKGIVGEHPTMKDLQIGTPEYDEAYAALRQRDVLYIAIAFHKEGLQDWARGALYDAAGIDPDLTALARAYMTGAKLGTADLDVLDAYVAADASGRTRPAIMESLFNAGKPQRIASAIVTGSVLGFEARALMLNTFEEIAALYDTTIASANEALASALSK